MKGFRLAIAFLAVGLIGVGLGWELKSRLGDRITTSRLSPDETFRASLSEREGSERHVRVRIENLVTGERITVFRSPDVGLPFGSERLIWSKDGTKLLLVGRHFFVKEDLLLDNGDQLFFLYDLPTGRSWCNSAEPTKDSPLNALVIQGIDFTERVRLKTR